MEYASKLYFFKLVNKAWVAFLRPILVASLQFDNKFFKDSLTSNEPSFVHFNPHKSIILITICLGETYFNNRQDNIDLIVAKQDIMGNFSQRLNRLEAHTFYFIVEHVDKEINGFGG